MGRLPGDRAAGDAASGENTPERPYFHAMGQRLGDCDVAFGIAGWSYRDWEGIVYPAGTRDRLRWLAGFVDLIEINASFYGFLPPATTGDWTARVADLPGFRFSVKANRLFTHEGERGFGTNEVRVFTRGLAPLVSAGRLVAVLFQFPYHVHDSPTTRSHLSTLARAFAELPLVIEVRHRSWAEPEALAFLGELGYSVANIDLPRAADTFAAEAVATGEPGYLRLHGRNVREWFNREAGRDAKYDYLYDDDELDELARRVETLATRFRELVIVTNNHYRGQALANLAELAARIGGGEQRLPEGLIRTFPRLAAVARPVAAAPGPPETGSPRARRERAPADSDADASRAPRVDPQRDLFEKTKGEP